MDDLKDLLPDKDDMIKETTENIIKLVIKKVKEESEKGNYKCTYQLVNVKHEIEYEIISFFRNKNYEIHSSPCHYTNNVDLNISWKE